MMVKKQRRGQLVSALLFALYILAFLLTENAVNEGSKLFISINVSAVYAAGLFCTAGGYLLFSLSRSLAKKQSARKALLLMISVAFVAFAAIFLTARSPAVFLAFSLLSLLCFGYIGGVVHYDLSVSMQDGRRTGRTIGLSCAAATLVQFAIQNLFNNNAVFIIIVICCVAAIFHIAARPPQDWFFENALPCGGGIPKKELLILAGAVFLMSVIMSVNDGIITTLHAQGAVNVLSWPRLFYALSVCAAGFIADIRGRKYMPLATVCALLLSVAAFIFLQRPDTYALNACVLYFYSGFYVLFLTVGFLDAAPKTARPELWAGMGRVIRSATAGALAIPSVYLFGHAGMPVFLIANAMLSIAVLLLLFFSGKLTERPEPPAPPSMNERLAAFSAEHRLTPRETDILAAVSGNEKTLAALADELGISERVLQRHLSSIYEKTGSQTRYGLAMSLHGIKLQ